MSSIRRRLYLRWANRGRRSEVRGQRSEIGPCSEICSGVKLRCPNCSRLTALSAGGTTAVPVKSLTPAAEVEGSERKITKSVVLTKSGELGSTHQCGVGGRIL